ncbi:hypothetical protein [Allomeiothermus silvanus]|uniref:hypothetical protein n=1 Tax=Allomeiothermus silvanus TaxID=52022 RepID=UPI0023EFFC76|nr:hypothetical protein [Allomeiothermus silvanus]
MRNLWPKLFVVSLVLLLAACGGQPKPEPDQEPVPTAVGAPVGSPVSKVIGASGGTLSSADGRLTVEVPAGAFAKDEAVGIQEIENHAHGRVGKAYRLTPEGVKFAKPVTLTFPYTDADIAGTAPELLGVAYQDEKGFWRAYKKVELNRENKTVSVETDHFSDWSMLAGAQLRPPSAEVQTGGSVNLQVAICEQVTSDDGLTSLAYGCEPSQLISRFVKNWSVNGAPGGNASVGMVAAGEGGAATYTAPAQVPSKNPVAVSAEYTNVHGNKFILISNVTVTGAAQWSGTVEVKVRGEKNETVQGGSSKEVLDASHTYEVTGVEYQDAAGNLILKTKGSGIYARTLDSSYSITETVYCSELKPNEQSIRKGSRTIREGGFEADPEDSLGITSGGGKYRLSLTTGSIYWTGTVTSYVFYKGACNPYSDVDSTTTTNSAGNFQSLSVNVEENLETPPADGFSGSKTYEQLIDGFNATVTVKWNIRRSGAR